VVDKSGVRACLRVRLWSLFAAQSLGGKECCEPSSGGPGGSASRWFLALVPPMPGHSYRRLHTAYDGGRRAKKVIRIEKAFIWRTGGILTACLLTRKKITSL
jgi:hypothetical protein